MSLGTPATVKLTPFDPAAAVGTPESAGGELLAERIARVAAERREQQVAAVVARDRMSFLRRNLQPVLALIHRPGISAKPEEKALALRQMLSGISSGAQKLFMLVGAGHENKRWFIDSATAAAAEMVGNKWVFGESADISPEISALIEAMPAIEDLIQRTAAAPDDSGPSGDAEVRAALRISIIKASEPLMSEVVTNPISADPMVAFQTLQDQILDRTNAKALPAGFESLPPPLRVQLMQAYLHSASRVMLAEYARVSASGATAALNTVVARWSRSMDVLERTVEANMRDVQPRVAKETVPAVMDKGGIQL